MAEDETAQPPLITGYYRCHNCGRDVEETKKARRFHLCPSCWDEVHPDFDQKVIKEGRDPGWYAETPEQRAEIEEYWSWFSEMQDRYPLTRKYFRFLPADSLPVKIYLRVKAANDVSHGPGRYEATYKSSQRTNPYEIFTADAFYPFCECGRERRELKQHGVTSIFGRLRAPKCPVCEAKAAVETIFTYAPVTHPGKDDEEMLDLLHKSHPEAFASGVLPDYWYELKRKEEHGTRS